MIAETAALWDAKRNLGERERLGVILDELKRSKRSASPLEAHGAEAIADRYSHPEWVVRRWIKELGEKEAVKLCEANNKPWPVGIRTNILRTSPEKLAGSLRRAGAEIAPGRFLPECMSIIRTPRGMKLTDLDAFQGGLFQVQDESAAVVSKLVDPKLGEMIIDACAAPGGKSTHLAALMRNRGKILALDLNPKRLSLVRENCKRLDIRGVTTQAADALKFMPDAPADAVLIDAPCSGFGVLGRKTDIRWSKSERDLAELNRLQLALLDQAARWVKSGGRIVYSTCTLIREENQEIVEKFLKSHPEFRVLSAAEFIPKELVSNNFYVSWPHRSGMGGAFGAILVKE